MSHRHSCLLPLCTKQALGASASKLLENLVSLAKLLYPTRNNRTTLVGKRGVVMMFARERHRQDG